MALVTELMEIKKEIEKTTVPSDILTLLSRLDELTVDRSALSTTKIGVTVGSLRQHQDEKVQQKSFTLVAKWKAAIGRTNKKSSKNTSNRSTTDSQEASQVSDRSETPSDNATPIVPISSAKFDSKGTSARDYPGANTGDSRRDKTRQLLWKALCDGVPNEQLLLMSVEQTGMIAAEIEQAVYNKYLIPNNDEKEYWSQIRAIRSNLNDKSNPELNLRIYIGIITPENLAEMSSLGMASDSKKAEREQQWKEMKEACQSDWDLRNVKRSAGQFPCNKCKSSDTSYFQMQTRSADEPMTTFVSCQNCGHRWKF